MTDAEKMEKEWDNMSIEQMVEKAIEAAQKGTGELIEVVPDGFAKAQHCANYNLLGICLQNMVNARAFLNGMAREMAAQTEVKK